MTPPRPSILLFAVLTLVALTWAPALGGGFVWDDHPLIVENPRVHTLAAPWQWFGADTWALPLGRGKATNAYFRPLTGLTFSVDWALGGGQPWAFHTTNLLLHLACVGLLFALTRRMGASPMAASMVALLLGVHPRSAEPVAWISGRTDLLACAFVLGALRVEWGAPGLVRRRWAVAALLLLGLWSKEVAMVGVVAVVALGLWRLAKRETTLGAEALAGVPLVVMLATWAVVRNHALGRQSGVTFQAPGLVLGSLGRHVSMLGVAWFPQAHVGLPGEAPAWAMGLGAVALLGLGAGAAWLFSPRRALGPQGALVLSAGAALGLASLFALKTWSVAADRYLLLPAALLLAALAPALKSPGSLAILGALAVSFLPVSNGRAAQWADELRFWTAEVREANPRNPAPHEGLGDALFARARFEEALPHYEQARALGGGETASLARASTLSRLGRHAEAQQELERLLSLRPDWTRARLDTILFAARAGEFERAQTLVDELRRAGPPPAELGRLETLILDAKVALEARGSDQLDTTGVWILARARAWDSLGATAEARKLYAQLVEVEPGSVVQVAALSWLVLQGEPQAARAAMQALERGGWGSPADRQTLSRVLDERLGR